MDNGRKRGGIVGPLILIAIGTILLLNNLNLMAISLFDLGLRIWPAVLIAFGLDLMIPRRSIWGTFLALVLIIGVLLGSFWLFDVVQTKPGRATNISHPLAEAKRAQVELAPAVGELRIEGTSEEYLLISGTVNSPVSAEPHSEVNVEGTTISYQLESPADPFGLFDLRLSDYLWELQLTDGVPIELMADIGVGSMLLDLRQLGLHSLGAHFGIGRASIQLPADQEIAANIDGGIGDLEVVLPIGADVEIQLDRGITSLEFPAGYRQQGDLVLSPGIEEGEADINMNIDLGIGSIRIRQRE